MQLSEIRTKQRQLLDETTADFWTDAELDNYTNQGYYFYWTWMIDAQHPLTLTSTTLNIVSGTSTIALPSDFLRVRLLEKVESDANYPLKYFERYDEPDYTGSGFVGSYFDDFTYNIEGSNIVLSPTPQNSETGGLKLTYFKRPTELSADSDTPEIDSFYHYLLVLYGVIKAKRKEEMIGMGGTDVGSFVFEQKEMEKAFKNNIELKTNQRTYVKPFFI